MNTIEAYKYLLEAPGVNAVHLPGYQPKRLRLNGQLESYDSGQKEWVSLYASLSASEKWRCWYPEPKEKSNEEFVDFLFSNHVDDRARYVLMMNEMDRKVERAKR